VLGIFFNYRTDGRKAGEKGGGGGETTRPYCGRPMSEEIPDGSGNVRKRRKKSLPSPLCARREADWEEKGKVRRAP